MRIPEKQSNPKLSSELLDVHPSQDNLTIYYSKAINRYNKQKAMNSKVDDSHILKDRS